MSAASYQDQDQGRRPVAGRGGSAQLAGAHPSRPGWLLPPHVGTRLDSLMRDVVADLAGPLSQPLMRVIDAGGKKLRPALTLAVAGLLGRSAEDAGVLQAAAAVELLHCATLVHDDLIDGAAMRRGVATLSAREGCAAAVVGGDLLIAAACELASEVSPQAPLILTRTLAQLCRGEALQDQLRYDARAPAEVLMEVARLKTGSLLQAACLLGALTGQAEPAFCSAAGEFGMTFGICVQLVDDLLDLVSSPALAAKPVGADFAAGTVTLPIALAIAHCPELSELLQPGLSLAGQDRALALLRDSTAALGSTAATVRRCAQNAGERMRAAAVSRPAARQLACWPAQYVEGQLRAKAGAQHRWLVAPLASGAP